MPGIYSPMRLGLRILENLTSVNSYDAVQSAGGVVGDPLTLSFQLVDLSKDVAAHGFSPAGRRYVPASGSTMNVTAVSVESGRTIVRPAVQPYPTQDPSLWQVAFTGADTVGGSVRLKAVLLDNGVQRTAIYDGAISMQSDDGMTRC